MTLGSLFDGIGGFPLAGVMCGITPVWSSEIEPFPMKVSAARFPHMKQLGSVTDINGAEIEPVDIITFGSPCQDLSVAGKQLGIHEGQRSNLFFEAVRIIKEMREADERTGRTDEHIRPRFAVWENVPGAFSSNKGADFQAVLEALASVRENGVSIPQPKKWGGAGCVVGNGWSIAWRVYDAQYWGVPQRRKRIYLIADFASERAGEILFEREGLRGDIAEGRAAREGTAADTERSVGGSGGVRCFALKGNYIDRDTKQNGIGWRDGEMYTLDATDRHGVCYPEIARSLCARADSSPCIDRGQNVVCYDARGRSMNDMRFQNYTGDGIAATLDASYYKGTGARNGKEREIIAVCIGNGQTNNISMKPIANTLDTMDDQQKVMYESDKPYRKYIVRRLTPTECARLQGFPDWWCEGLGGSDSAIYKAYGNGLALPCAYDVLRRIAKEGDTHD